MLSLFREKPQPKVFMEQDEGTIFFLIEVSSSNHSLTFLRLQPTPRVYKNFVFERKHKRDDLCSFDYSRDKWLSVPGHIERLGLSIVPSHQEYQKVRDRDDSLDKKISGFDRRMWGLPPLQEVDPALYSEREKCEISIKQFWSTCDRLYDRMLNELELDNLAIQSNPNEALSSRLGRVHELLDLFDETADDEISQITPTKPISLEEETQQYRLSSDNNGMTLDIVSPIWEKFMIFHDKENTQIMIFISGMLALAIGGFWILHTTIVSPMVNVAFRPLDEALGEEVTEEPVFTMDLNQTLLLWVLYLAGGTGFHFWMKFCYCQYLRD